MDDNFDKELKGLLDAEFESEKITVSEELIQKTLAKVMSTKENTNIMHHIAKEDTVITKKPIKWRKGSRTYWKWTATAAALLIIIGISRFASFTNDNSFPQKSFDTDSTGQNINGAEEAEITVKSTESKPSDTELGEDDTISGISPEGAIENSLEDQEDKEDSKYYGIAFYEIDKILYLSIMELIENESILFEDEILPVEEWSFYFTYADNEMIREIKIGKTEYISIVTKDAEETVLYYRANDMSVLHQEIKTILQ